MFVFNNFDAFAEVVSEWDLDFKQISSGSLKGTIELAGSSEIQLISAVFDKKVAQIGMSPEGRYTFSFLMPTSASTFWCNQTINNSYLLELVENREFEAVSQPGLDVVTISISNNKFKNEALKLGYEKVPSTNLFTAHLIVSDEQKSICLIVQQLMLKNDSWLRESLEDRLIFIILGILSRNQNYPIKNSHRQRGLDMATQFIRNNLKENFYSEDILRASHVSKRTLEYAFQEHFGLTPKKYIKCLKLNRIHLALLNKEKDFSITEVAQDYNFSNMGQFAKDYQALFGCLPSKMQEYYGC